MSWYWKMREFSCQFLHCNLFVFIYVLNFKDIYLEIIRKYYWTVSFQLFIINNSYVELEIICYILLLTKLCLCRNFWWAWFCRVRYQFDRKSSFIVSFKYFNMYVLYETIYNTTPKISLGKSLAKIHVSSTNCTIND